MSHLELESMPTSYEILWIGARVDQEPYLDQCESAPEPLWQNLKFLVTEMLLTNSWFPISFTIVNEQLLSTWFRFPWLPPILAWNAKDHSPNYCIFGISVKSFCCSICSSMTAIGKFLSACPGCQALSHTWNFGVRSFTFSCCKKPTGVHR
jgi:hypothetical protein